MVKWMTSRFVNLDDGDEMEYQEMKDELFQVIIVIDKFSMIFLND